MKLPISGKEANPFRYLLFNKPFNVLSQFTIGSAQSKTSAARKTLADFVPVRDVYPAGRLDYDSEGLMLLTSDGWLQHRLSDPRYAHSRVYWAQVEGLVTNEATQRLQAGVRIQGYGAKALTALQIEEPALPPRDPPIRFRMEIPTSWMEIAIAEGRNRQVRRMTAAVGLPTLRLVRVGIGPLRLDTLKPGAWRDLTGSEIQAVGYSR